MSLYVLCFWTGVLLGQTVQKQVIASGGNTLSNTTTTLTATIGEPIIGNRGATVTIGQGFLAGIATNSTLSITDVLQEEVKLYPNPVQDFLTISLSEFEQPLEVFLYSATGQKVATYNLKDELFTIPMGALSKGLYLIQLHFKESNTIKTFKIIKN